MTTTVPIDQLLDSLPERLDHMIRRHAEARPDAPAIDQEGGILTYGAFNQTIDTAAESLQSLGVRPGDRVMLVNENCAAALVMLFAIMRLDAWAVLVNARVADRDVDLIRDHCRPRLMLFTQDISAEAAAHGARNGAETREIAGIGPVLVADRPDAEAEPTQESGAEQVAVMIYTTGTTGQPKGVMLTHRNLLYSAAVSGQARGMGATDKVYAVLPMAHIFGLTSTQLSTLFAGGCVTPVARFDAAHLADALARDITVFQGVPAMYAGLLELRDAGRAITAPRLRFLSVGGAPMGLDLRRRVEEMLGITLCNGYGMTETSPTVTLNRPERPLGDDSVGIPLDGQELRMVDREGHLVPPGEVGELWVRGPNIMKGYYRNPEATAQVIDAEGWLNTGDLARQTEDGALYIVGRSKELIIRSGFNVYPPEVEAVLDSHDAVMLSAVVGRKVPGNEEVTAFIQAAPGRSIDEGELAEFAKSRLTAYKRPARFIFLDAIPAAPNGKPLKVQLAERLNAGEFDR